MTDSSSPSTTASFTASAPAPVGESATTPAASTVASATTATNATVTTNSRRTISSSSQLLDQPDIKRILISDSSFTILLSRLKQSIKACDEFANFIRRKHSYEEDNVRDVRKTASACRNSITTSCVPTRGSFVDSLLTVIAYDDKLTSVRTPYIKALETMYHELMSLSQNFTRLRKQLKEEGNRREKEAIDAINQAEKSRSKYKSLCSDLEKLRNSDQTQKKITLQGRKTGTQQEEELTRKLHIADADYNKKAHYSQKCKNELVDLYRPQIATKMKDLILELDHALQLQLSKYAVYNESLIIGMGNQITPLGHNHASMQETASSVDVEKSLYGYLISNKVERKSAFVPVEYKRHSVFGGLTPDGSFGNGRRIASAGSATSSASVPPIVAAPVASFSVHPAPVYHTSDPRAISSSSPPSSSEQTGLNGPRPMITSEQPLLTSELPVFPSGQIPTLDEESHSAMVGGLFGLPIDEVPHDDEMVPLFVARCIDLLEKYGSNSEGIYRSSPNKTKLEEMKEILDSDPGDLSVLDPPDVSNISNDYIFMIASLLKNFFSKLPEPLLTIEQGNNFLKAGQIEDVKTMHLQLHRIVFELPDANYFTLRDLLFHFIHLSQMPKVRMSVRNLAIVWSNNLFAPGSATTTNDLHLQQRVVEELINAAPDIFNPIGGDN
ncbi:DEKNAAC103967 [Brettanomyces naardenensis]|uniref:DEKNAAC103967 n=1 Tax=Brettanomyces naardenensis TaxID=13370 RepID=A0A448YPJ8_BRENA|nr:DEKNAAC103967 [Brettanomyces naardenensis]